jgi:hypothetical protein
METIAIMKSLGILSGKQKEYNIQVLTALYDNGPLTAWEITSKLTDTNKQSLHATLNKRLRNLEKKSYVKKEGKKWLLGYKGIIANLIIQPEPRMWSLKWKERFEHNKESIGNNSKSIFGLDSQEIQENTEFVDSCLEDFNVWVNYANIVKKLIANGVVNFDQIKESTLLGLVILEAMSLEDLSKLPINRDEPSKT